VQRAIITPTKDGRNCREAERIGSKKLAMVRGRLAQLKRVEEVLAALVDQCHCNTGKVNCPLIDALEYDKTAVARVR
jgi:MerR family mercuric resistance operon transcriptional regulator